MSGGWSTIESDAGVFTNLVGQLGVKDVQTEELLSLDVDHLKRISPVYGVIFLFRYPTKEQSSDMPRDGYFDFECTNSIFFAAQTIQNACGTQALLSIILNKDSQLHIGPQLTDFKDFTCAFPAELRGEALSNSALIRDAHNSFARSSPFINDEQKHANDDDDDIFHFIAYTPIGGHLYELDGLQRAPINHGACTFDEFPEKIIPVLKSRIDRYPANEICFNVLAVVRDLRIRAQSIGDQDWLYREEQRRIAWRRENALRKHNFIGFVGELMKGVVASKSIDGQSSCEQWVEEAKTRTLSRRQEKSNR